MANHVFITHAVEDKEIANRVCEALESNGIQCWIAPRDVPYGMNFEEAIVDAICGSKLMILILSTHSNNSPHVKREIQNACMEDAQTPILPFRVEDIRLNKALRYYLGSTQWLDASTPPLESHFESLIKRVRVYLPQEAEAEADSKAEAEAGDKPAEAEALARQQTEAEALAHGLAAEEAARQEAEAEAVRKAEVEAARKRAEAEALARQQAEAEALANRLAAEEAVRKKTEAEAVRKVEAEKAGQLTEAEALFRQQTEPSEEKASRPIAIQQPDKHTPEPVPFSGFGQPLERPNRRLLYVSAGATLAVVIIIVAAVAYIYNQNSGSQSLATVPAEANSPRTDQPSGTGVTNPTVNSNTVTYPSRKPTPAPSPYTTVKPSPERTATSDEPQPSPTPRLRAPISGGVLNGKALSLPKPVYPRVAAAARASGTVIVQVIIDEDGNVISADPVSGPPLLHAAAVRAARQAKFSPTSMSGQRVKVSGVIQYHFASNDPPSSTAP